MSDKSLEESAKSVAREDASKAVNPLFDPAPYGYCPVERCGAPGVSRERRPNGNDTCANGHVYPSASALAEKPPAPSVQPYPNSPWMKPDDVVLTVEGRVEIIDSYPHLKISDTSTCGELIHTGNELSKFRDGTKVSISVAITAVK